MASENSAFMREVIASVVGADQEKYSEAILGKENKAYCNWILGKDAWGGAIEVQILAEYFQVEIMVVDIKSGGTRSRTGEFVHDPICPRQPDDIWGKPKLPSTNGPHL